MQRACPGVRDTLGTLRGRELACGDPPPVSEPMMAAKSGFAKIELRDSHELSLHVAFRSRTFDDCDVLATACGCSCMHRKRIDISTVLARQRFGIKNVDEDLDR